MSLIEKVYLLRVKVIYQSKSITIYTVFCNKSNKSILLICYHSISLSSVVIIITKAGIVSKCLKAYLLKIEVFD
jgi:hypothetical protein